MHGAKSIPAGTWKYVCSQSESANASQGGLCAGMDRAHTRAQQDRSDGEDGRLDGRLRGAAGLRSWPFRFNLVVFRSWGKRPDLRGPSGGMHSFLAANFSVRPSRLIQTKPEQVLQYMDVYTLGSWGLVSTPQPMPLQALHGAVH